MMAWPDVLRSVNIVTGALIGAVASVAYIVAGIATEIAIGRPSPDQTGGTILIALPILGGLGVLAGGLLGGIGRLVVRRTALAGSAEGSIVVGTFVAAALIAGFLGVQAARQSEARHEPRVMRSTGAVTRTAGFGTLRPGTSAVRLLSSWPGAEVAALSWRGGTVGVRLDGETLIISRDSAVVDQVSLSGLDYVTGVYGVTATDARGQEFLALLVRLRATGRRELLCIYDSAGALAHEELLARTASGSAPALWNGGQPGGEQGFLLDVGEPLRYVIKK